MILAAASSNGRHQRKYDQFPAMNRHEESSKHRRDTFGYSKKMTECNYTTASLYPNWGVQG